MSITPMKFATVVGPLADLDDVLLECVVNHEFHPEPAARIAKRMKTLHSFDIDNPYIDLLRQAETVLERIGIPLDYSGYSAGLRDYDEMSRYIDDAARQYNSLLSKKAELESIIGESAQILTQLEHLRGLNVEISEFFKVKFVKFRFGHMPRDTYDNLIPMINERSDVFFFPTSIERDAVYGMYMTPRGSMEHIDSLFASVQFIRTRISDRVHGTSDQAVQFINQESADAQKALKALTKEIAEFKDSRSEKLLAIYSYVRLMNDSYDLRRFAAHTHDSFHLVGWVPENELGVFTENLKKNSPDSILVTEGPENVVDYRPPVKLRNNALFRAFEPFVSIYGLPSYDELDPTPFLAISYTLLFGIMFGDVGQGAVLAAAGLLLYKFKKLWLGRAAVFFGISSMCFGFLYGSVFGSEDIIHGWAVLEGNHSEQILQYSIYISLIVLVCAMLLNICNGIRQRDYVKILFGPNSISGLIFYLALMGIMLPVIGFAVQLLPVGVFALIAALPLLLLFFREPLGKLAERRKDWKPDSAGDFVVSNFFELIEFLLSYLTNTISFLRVGAYAISHASMMAVVYMLTESVGGGHNIVGLILGNIIIMAIEALLVGIQVLRLQFYEVFSRFYSGAGQAYAPVIIDYKKSV